MTRVLVPAVAAVVITAAASGADWSIEPVGPGTKPVIKIDGEGVISIAWVVSGANGAVYYAQREENGWAIETALPGDFGPRLDLAINGDGQARIAYHDHTSGHASFLIETPSSWTFEFIHHEGHDGWNPSIALASDGTAHLASFDPETGIEYAKQEQTGWLVEEVGTSDLEISLGTSLALDNGEKAHLCYHDGDDAPPPEGAGNLYYSVREPDGWKTEVVDSDGDVGKFPSLALDSNGTPHVAYLKRLTPTSAIVRHARKVGDGWLIEDVLVLDRVGETLSNAHRTLSLVVDDRDRPHIAAADQDSVHYATVARRGWAVQTVIEQTSPSHLFSELATVALDPDGGPHIAFHEKDTSGGSSLGTIYLASAPPPAVVRARTPQRRVRPVGANTPQR